MAEGLVVRRGGNSSNLIKIKEVNISGSKMYIPSSIMANVPTTNYMIAIKIRSGDNTKSLWTHQLLCNKTNMAYEYVPSTNVANIKFKSDSDGVYFDMSNHTDLLDGTVVEDGAVIFYEFEE